MTADTATLVAFQAAREAAGDSPSTIRRRWSALSSFYEFVLDETAPHPTRRTASPTRVADGNPSPTARLSAETVAAYRAAAAALDPRLDALVALLVADGLKLGEVLALDVGDVRAEPPRRRHDPTPWHVEADRAPPRQRPVGASMHRDAAQWTALATAASPKAERRAG